MVQKAWKFIIVLCVLEVVILQPPLKYEKRRRPWSMPVRLGGRSKSQNSKRERERGGGVEVPEQGWRALLSGTIKKSCQLR